MKGDVKVGLRVKGSRATQTRVTKRNGNREKIFVEQERFLKNRGGQVKVHCSQITDNAHQKLFLFYGISSYSVLHQKNMEVSPSQYLP